jgi:hypothetical protein
MSTEGSERNGAHDLAEFTHERNGLVIGLLRDTEEAVEVTVVQVLLAGEIRLEGSAGEETVKALAKIDVGLAVKEYPVVVTEELVGDIDDARLNETGGVEDLPGHITGGRNDDEPN